MFRLLLPDGWKCGPGLHESWQIEADMSSTEWIPARFDCEGSPYHLRLFQLKYEMYAEVQMLTDQGWEPIYYLSPWEVESLELADMPGAVFQVVLERVTKLLSPVKKERSRFFGAW